MSYYADLDVSVLDELPPGRTPIKTKLVSDARRDEVIARVRGAVASGRQAYWVCPLIEESEKLQLQTALDTFAALSEELDDLRIGLVHGRLQSDEKAAAMAAFAASVSASRNCTSCGVASGGERTIRCVCCFTSSRYRKPQERG
jgi:ATP-dependent DNA helicase RecG